MRRTKIRVAGVSDTAEQKKEIQRLVREIVIKRDGGCILRFKRGCGGELGQTTIQADHLISRANSATYADTRLIVCVCLACHGWKHWHEKEYDALVKTIIPKENLNLWERCEAERHAHKTKKMDWGLEILALQKELSMLV